MTRKLILVIGLLLGALSSASAQQTLLLYKNTAGGNTVVSTGNPLPVNATATVSFPTIGAAVPTTGIYNALNVAGTLRGMTGLALGSTFSQTIAIVDASGNQITTFGTAWVNTNKVIPWDGTTSATFKAASTAAAQTDTALVGRNPDIGFTNDTVCASATGNCTLIALQKYNNNTSPSVVQATAANLNATVVQSGTWTVQPGNTANTTPWFVTGSTLYETVAASQTGQALGPTGATGDYLSHCVVYPGTTSPGVVTVFDSTSSAANNVIAFTGGASSVSNLVPFTIAVGAISVNGAWKVTTGANVIVTCYGKFT